MLAEDEITIRFAGETLFLRPTLLAAIRLERRFCGFDKIISDLLDDNVTTMAAVIRESAIHASDIPDIIASLADMPLCTGIAALREPLISHTLRLAGRDGAETETDDDPNAKRVSFAEHFARLFAIGTGWLGWSPETTYDATAAEIEAAFAGRIDMLKAIFGGEQSSMNAEPLSPDQFNAKVMAFAKSMGTRKVAA